MRRVLVYWSLIFTVLAAGATVIFYSEMELKREQDKTEHILLEYSRQRHAWTGLRQRHAWTGRRQELEKAAEEIVAEEEVIVQERTSDGQ